MFSENNAEYDVVRGPLLDMLLVVLVINLLFITLFYKEIKLSTFDPMYSLSVGIPVVLLHYGYMTIVSMTTVSAFDSVGSILMVLQRKHDL